MNQGEEEKVEKGTKIPITIRLDSKTYEKMFDRASIEDRSLNYIINDTIKKGMGKCDINNKMIDRRK